ncbi:GNAT family N-acetyltransferase [Bacillus sp. EB600]|uniref:GNAT family N-acetyltransferase n=1 Tax=Bacillus sp. EB600 TaxID=2806345 RepID=UPI00210E9AE5|nr:GNAT family N-acetyltransferase [Bacillus sp. EB600]MCQ6282133.1 GNAT family N-acetyltransferase [Bacillus sp. EB600]
MELSLKKSKITEADSLFNIQKEVFQSDLKKYQDYDSSPATEHIDFFRYRLNQSLHYTVYIDGKINGGVCILILTDTHFHLFRIFLHSDCQNNGIGTTIMNEIERKFPTVKTWSLNTPKDNVRNRHFYEKLGYRKTGEQKINSRLTLIEYQKVK